MEILLEQIISEQPGEVDLRLSVPDLGLSRVIDSYYYLLDNDNFGSDSTNLEHILSAHFHKLENLLVKASKSDVVYLPVEYSDQYIGCFRVLVRQQRLQIDYGFTVQYQGANHWPRNIDLFKPNDFSSLSVELSVDFPSFVAALKSAVRIPPSPRSDALARP